MISVSARKRARRKSKAAAAANPKELVDRAGDIMRLFKPSPFSGEGWLVETVRHNRIAMGWDFKSADESARALAISALKSIGFGIRPKLHEAQPFTFSAPRCKVCGDPIEMVFGGWHDRVGTFRKYCSVACMREAHRAEVPEKPCQHCGIMFRGDPAVYGTVNEQKYCGIPCFAAATASTRYADRNCLHCDKVFTPAPGRDGENQKFCSKKCYFAHADARRAERICERCRNPFRPTTLYGKAAEKQRFCSAECANPPAEVRPCVVCHTEFKVRKDRPNQQTCGKACRDALRRS